MRLMGDRVVLRGQAVTSLRGEFIDPKEPSGAGRRSQKTLANLRIAVAQDVPAITDIYNYEIETSTSTFDTEPLSVENRGDWLADHDPQRHPVIVAEQEGVVVGWASLSAWSGRCAYARAAEVSVYVHRDHRGRGHGRALLGEMIGRGRAVGLGVLLARIVSPDGRTSVRLHEAAGFRPVGTMHRVGEKFGRILDVVVMERDL